MCILLFAWRVLPSHPLVLIANRDEFHDRQALPAHAWEQPQGLFGGRDLSAGGTWLGATASGRFAALTNYRDFRLPLPEQAPSRGELVTGFLQADDPLAWLRDLEQQGAKYAGFNLLASDGHRLWHLSNHGGPLEEVAPGFHGLSNALMDTPWPKVTQGTAALRQKVEQGQFDPMQLMPILQDRQQGPDHLLPDTGRDLEFERRVSPIFLHDPVYGTRCSSYYLQPASGPRQLWEMSYDPAGSATGIVHLELPGA